MAKDKPLTTCMADIHEDDIITRGDASRISEASYRRGFQQALHFAACFLDKADGVSPAHLMHVGSDIAGVMRFSKQKHPMFADEWVLKMRKRYPRTR